MKYQTLLSFVKGIIETGLSRNFMFDDIAEATIRSCVFSQSNDVLVEILRQKPELLAMPITENDTTLTSGQLLRFNLEKLLLNDLRSVLTHNASIVRHDCEQYAA